MIMLGHYNFRSSEGVKRVIYADLRALLAVEVFRRAHDLCIFF